jgi:hypothetical protein
MFNARSINNKLSDLHYLLYAKSFDVICITESWLNNNVVAGLIDPECQYTVLRCDRHDRRGGGVCFLINKHLNVIQVPIGNYFPNIEALCVDVYCNDNCVRLLGVYRPPGFDAASVLYMQDLVDCMLKFVPHKNPCYIVGDFNCPNINWLDCAAPADNIQDKLLRFATDNGFTQIVNLCEQICVYKRR